LVGWSLRLQDPQIAILRSEGDKRQGVLLPPHQRDASQESEHLPSKNLKQQSNFSDGFRKTSTRIRDMNKPIGTGSFVEFEEGQKDPTTASTQAHRETDQPSIKNSLQRSFSQNKQRAVLAWPLNTFKSKNHVWC
jgi:hypothetical protein